VGIGETLARARGRAGLTVATVSERTRIRETLIRAIEADDYSGCGGDFYARGHIRSIAATVGADPEPLVYEYDKKYRAPQEITVADAFEPVRPIRVRERRRRPFNWSRLLLLALVVVVGLTVYFLVGGSSHATHKPQASASHPPAKHHASTSPSPQPSKASPTPSPTPSHSPPPPPATTLTPASVTTFGPGGAGQGDNPQLARGAVGGGSWHTDWYASASFGGLQHGTGLLLNMGRSVTITAAKVTFGGSPGAAFQLRAGDGPTLAELKTVARAGNASGVVNLRLPDPARGRYVLIWITKLPQDSSGTFQASVSGIKISGQT
jgi:cytoskeletal protein RodZ